MGNTLRKVVRAVKNEVQHSNYDTYSNDYEVVTVDESKAKHQVTVFKRNKMKAYVKDGASKYRYSHAEPESKLVIKNANRTLKKGERHRLKNELRREVEALQNEQE